MAHQKFTPTGKTAFGRPLLKPDRPMNFRDTRVAKQIAATQGQLEILERAALVRRAKERGERIRSKTRLGTA